MTITQNINEIDRKITDHNHDNSITTPGFSKLTLEHIAARLKQADLASKINVVDLVKKTDFDNKLLGFNKKKNSSNITKHAKHVVVENELNELTKNNINKRIKQFNKWI